MRIAFTGAAGVGKTTLSNWLAEELNIPVVGEMAKEMIGKEYDFYDTWNNLDSFFEFQEDVIDRKIKAESQPGSFVADRTIHDCSVFMKMRLARERNLSSEALEKYQRINSKIAANGWYDYVFFVPQFTEKVEDDGKRNTNPFYIEVFETMLKKHIDGLSSKFNRIDLERDSSLEERKEDIRNSLTHLNDRDWETLKKKAKVIGLKNRVIYNGF